MRKRLLVISPVRDEAEHLDRVVAAMAAQERTPDRWLIVDDGSTDGTAEIARAAAERLPFCEALHAPADLDAAELAGGRLAVAAECRAFTWALEPSVAPESDYEPPGEGPGTELATVSQ